MKLVPRYVEGRLQANGKVMLHDSRVYRVSRKYVDRLPRDVWFGAKVVFNRRGEIVFVEHAEPVPVISAEEFNAWLDEISSKKNFTRYDVVCM